MRGRGTHRGVLQNYLFWHLRASLSHALSLKTIYVSCVFVLSDVVFHCVISPDRKSLQRMHQDKRLQCLGNKETRLAHPLFSFDLCTPLTPSLHIHTNLLVADRCRSSGIINYLNLTGKGYLLVESCLKATVTRQVYQSSLFLQQ